MCSPSRFEVKARRVPSGDHRGVASRFVPEVNFRGGSEPSTGASEMAPRYSLASPSTLQTAKATVPPSGDTLGSAAPLASNTSSGVIPAIAAPLGPVRHLPTRDRAAARACFAVARGAEGRLTTPRGVVRAPL